jgi:uncharacterized oxidoreductase
MQLNSNTIFITGGSSGIGKGLAEAFHKLGNKVIISGRRESRLKEICAANPGMRYFVLDVTDRSSIHRVAEEVIRKFPDLNCVFNNAGIQKDLDFSMGGDFNQQALLEEINTNLVGLIQVAVEFLPHLRKRPNAALVNVSSGLAFVPLALCPVYCATKAAVHSFSLSLRHQMKDSGVKIIELVPPYVATELGGPEKTSDDPRRPQPMRLDVFIEQTMQELSGDGDEIAIGDAKKLVGAAGLETVKKVFAGMNR